MAQRIARLWYNNYIDLNIFLYVFKFSFKGLFSIVVTEMERELTVERVRKGIRKAQLYGTRSGNPIGRPARLIPPSFKKYYTIWKDKEITGVEFAKLLDVSRPTLYRYVREYESAS